MFCELFAVNSSEWIIGPQPLNAVLARTMPVDSVTTPLLNYYNNLLEHSQINREFVLVFVFSSVIIDLLGGTQRN